MELNTEQEKALSLAIERYKNREVYTFLKRVIVDTANFCP